MPIEPYFRRVFYYETDRMGFVHHSNYIRWLEEARMDYMRKLGIDCKLLEDQGIIIPVTGVSCEYRQSVYFDDWEKKAETEFDPGRFYLTQEGVTVFYPLYTLAPYVEGMPAFTIPWPLPPELPKEEPPEQPSDQKKQ